MRGEWSNRALIAVFAVVALTALLRNDVFSRRTNVIDWDGYGYYLYLPGAFVYGDVTHYAFAEEHLARYDVSGDLYQLMTADNGRRFPIYNAGLAVLWTPPFLLTHGLTRLTGWAPADGMSYPYQLMVLLTGLCFVFLGLWYLRRFLLLHYPDRPVALTLLAIGLATNIFYYWVEKPAMTHGYLFAGYAVLLYHLTQYERTGSRRHFLVCGLTLGMLCLIRSSEIVAFALPALVGLRDRVSLERNFRRTCALVGIAALVFSLQLLSYKIGTDAWWRNGYAGLGFDWFDPHLYEGLFGYRRGWLVYTPLMVFALVGIVFLPARWRYAVLVFTLANLYLLFSWHIWWYGNTFGSRPVTQSYAVLALPLAALIARFTGKGGEDAGGEQRRKVGWGRPAVVLLLLLPLAALNLFQHWQYNERILPLDFVNRTYYWHVFGKTTLDRADYVYLDTDEKLPPGTRVARSFGVVDSVWHVPPKARREFTNLQEFTVGVDEARPGAWWRTRCEVRYHGDVFDKWKFPSVVTEHRRGKEVLKWRQVNIPRALPTATGGSLAFDLSLPGLRAGDVVKQYVWNLSGDSLVVSDLRTKLVLVAE